MESDLRRAPILRISKIEVGRPGQFNFNKIHLNAAERICSSRFSSFCGKGIDNYEWLLWAGEMKAED